MERGQLTIATKFGEHWDAAAQQPYVDHSYAALKASLDRSMERLGGINALQLHKTTPEVLRGAELDRARERLRRDAGAIHNMENTRFEAVIDAAARGMRVVVNRPFAMGKILYDSRPEDTFGRMVQAFRLILAQALGSDSERNQVSGAFGGELARLWAS